MSEMFIEYGALSHEHDSHFIGGGDHPVAAADVAMNEAFQSQSSLPVVHGPWLLYADGTRYHLASQKVIKPPDNTIMLAALRCQYYRIRLECALRNRRRFTQWSTQAVTTSVDRSYTSEDEVWIDGELEQSSEAHLLYSMRFEQYLKWMAQRASNDGWKAPTF